MFLKLPNALLEMQLPPNALKVLCVLMSAADHENKTIMRTCVIARKCDVAAGTVCAAIKKLEAMGLVRREHVYKEDGTYAANKYTIALPVGGRWFALNLSEQVLQLPASSFSVYAAMLRFRGRNRKAFPSLFQLSSLLGLCKNTLLRAIRCLQSSGLIKKMTKWAGKHNLYLIQDTKKERLVEQKPDARTKQLDRLSNNISLTSVLRCVKRTIKKTSFPAVLDKTGEAGEECAWTRKMARSVVHFLNSIPIPTHYATKRRLNIRLKERYGIAMLLYRAAFSFVRARVTVVY